MMDFNQLCQSGFFSEIDRRFAGLMARYVAQDRDIVMLAAALVSRSTAQGNVCLDLSQTVSVEDISGDSDNEPAHVIDPSKWRAVLCRCPVVGQPGDFKPMIMDGARLYLHRHWQFEQEVAQGIRQRCRSITNADAEQDLADELMRLFPEGDERQRQGVLSALTQGFTVISGGPGTGKTYTIAKLILLMKQLSRASDLRLKLAAPTGKAAMRLQLSIETAMKTMGHDQAAQQLAGDNIQTVHRLLGARADQSGFQYHAGNQLHVDVLMVDEASMIDLALMAALMAALPAKARLVLIGDKNQLASVEAGAVLGDICKGIDDGKHATLPINQNAVHDVSLADRIVVLEHGYRFASKSGIDELAAGVNAGDTEAVQSLLNRPDSADVVFKRVDDPQLLKQAVEALATNAIVPEFNAHDPAEALARMERLMILSPLRNGPYGMKALNSYVEQVLVKHGWIDHWGTREDNWYAGRPVMVTRNDYYHNLFNGDMGVAINNEKGEEKSLSVYFPDGTGGYRQVSTRQLPPHQTAYAMTVHKSQGSEFERVILVLPDRESPILTRELVYTAITRARRTVEIWGTERCLNQAIRQRIQRSSGLGDLLWQSNTKQHLQVVF